MKKLLLFLAFLSVSSVLSLCQAEIRYSITDLETLGGSFSSADAINDNGQVVGRSDVAGNSGRHAFLYDGTEMFDLGTLLVGGYSSANAINDSGQIAGSSGFMGSSIVYAFLYDGTTMNHVGTLGGSYSSAHGINDSGQVVGYSYIAGHSSIHAFLYDGTEMFDLGTLGGNSYASAINGSGQIAGYSYTTGISAYHAFLYDGTTMNDLSTLGGTSSYAYAINDSGQVVGESNPAGTSDYHAFLYDGAKMNDLGTLGGASSCAYAINDSGQVVGESNPAGTSDHHAFLYDGANMVDLNELIPSDSGWERLIDAKDINSSGQIIGYGIIDGKYHAYLLTPVPESVIPVADAGDDILAYAGPKGTATVKLDGSGSFDADGDTLEYFWFNDVNELIAEGEDPNVILTDGVHVIELVVDDGTVSSETNSVVVTVVEAVEAVAYVFPRVLNSTSRGRYVIAKMELPDGISKDDIADDSLVLIIGKAVIGTIFQRGIGYGNRHYVFGFFDQGKVAAEAVGMNSLNITIAGELVTGQCVYGEDSIRVVKSRATGRRSTSRGRRVSRGRK